MNKQEIKSHALVEGNNSLTEQIINYTHASFMETGSNVYCSLSRNKKIPFTCGAIYGEKRKWSARRSMLLN